MGWLWKAPQQRQESTPDAPDASSTGTPPPPPALTREEQADAELRQFLASFEEANRQASLTDTPTQSNLQSTLQSNLPSNPPTQSPPGTTPDSIAPEALYADSMSCRSAFDYAFFCQSFGGQFVNVYRYGELRSCSEHWENFWLCMKARTYAEPRAKQVIRDHNRMRAQKYKTGPSSEDVWDMRVRPVKDAFSGDFAAMEAEMEAEAAAQPST
ncbi:hypothetical protein ASPZODRAFT_135656 [Penicilliopsis zonata CBS 506.65]|uniref:Early meiotic induction protein 1 n=1 Tax=Penicilliopsis zonata CBS 506.65 TaxID=1073090 RepID=A0A1L9SAL4_9EURO|nr:hypothetical protein ASPZODRAFT_135656 [Penicilliopsis zonata CBS 506.65]OJJ44167.1 hypothetical protein ASPZODRAFT_135656 [Penicilliopsis zonata CBS 506.65]